MPSTIWSLQGLDTLGSDLHLRQIIPWGASGEVVPLSVTSTVPPSQGVVADLLNETQAGCTFSGADLQASSFAIRFEFAAAVELRGFRFRKGQADVLLSRHSISMGSQSCTVGELLFDAGDLSRAPIVPLNFVSEAGSWIEQAAAGVRAWVGCGVQGSLLVAGNYGGYVHYSRDGGVTWAALTVAGQRSWHGCAISLDGQTAIVTCADVGSKPWISADGGLTWALLEAAPPGRWDVCAVSGDGQVLLIAGGSGYAYLSVDGGISWVAQVAPGSRSWRGCGVSGDGQTMMLVDAGASGRGWLSRDGGQTWAAQTAAGSRVWRGCAVSGDGRTLLMAPDGTAGPLMLSTDAGDTWTAQASAGSGLWYDCAVSGDGSVLIAADYGGNRLLLSIDHGASWAVAEVGAYPWYGCAVSADGAQVVGVAYPAGRVWLSYLYDPAYGEPVVSTGRLSYRAQLGGPVSEDAGCTRLSARHALDAEFGGDGVIYGPVELYNQAGNLPLSRRVRLHRSRDGQLVRETWSDAHGNYRFEGISQRYTYDVIAWDHEGLQRSVVANDLQPEAMA